MKPLKYIPAGLILFYCLNSGLYAQLPGHVTLQYNRLYEYDHVVSALDQLSRIRPELFSMKSIGKSVQGRNMWVVILNNPETGDMLHKPAMYIDADIHGNEVQGTEVILYTIDYLLNHYGKLDKVTRLMDQRVFYFIPMVNPDGRAHWFDREHMGSFARTGMAPTDNDHDGIADEDGYDDLDGDGEILQMRKKVPYGRYKISSQDPRLMERVPPGEAGDYELLGMEGIDNDGDGYVNEDGPGGYDMNRNWPSDWQPGYVQRGAGDYPLCYPETRCIADFILNHPNIAGVQAYHNSGGMILRAPGAKEREEFPPSDRMVYDYIGQEGEKILPFYRYYIIWKDLYTIHGGFVNWTSEGLGIFSFTNELWSSQQYFNEPRKKIPDEDRYLSYQRRQKERLKFDDLVELGARYKEWKPFDHPDYGKIELGGWVRKTNRIPPLFMLEELCHRNALFTLFHADQMPLLSIDSVSVTPLKNGNYQIRVMIANQRAIPSISAIGAKNRLIRPDIVTVRGSGIRVHSAGLVEDPWMNRVEPVEKRPERVLLPEGIPGNGNRILQFVVSGSGKGTILMDSQIGGKISRDFQVK